MASILPMRPGLPSTGAVLVAGLVLLAGALVPPPAPILPTDPQAALGARLFNDPRLSRDGDRSCASCHQPGRGWSDGLARAIGKDGRPLDRNTPGVAHLAEGSSFFWDGRADSLEEQALVPIAHPREMALPLDLLAPRLAEVPAYRTAFAAAFPGQDIGPDTVSQALAAFQRTLDARRSPVDRYLAGDPTAISPAARRGHRVFLAVRCNDCHDGPDFTDGSFHALGLLSPDPGRAEVMAGASLQGAMKVPSLRNVARSAPYMHDGSLPTLGAVVDFYNRGGDRPADPLMRPLHLSSRDRADLVAFLQALTDPDPVTLPAPP